MASCLPPCPRQCRSRSARKAFDRGRGRAPFGTFIRLLRFRPAAGDTVWGQSAPRQPRTLTGICGGVASRHVGGSEQALYEPTRVAGPGRGANALPAHTGDDYAAPSVRGRANGQLSAPARAGRDRVVFGAAVGDRGESF